MSVERGNFLTPIICVRFAVLVRRRWHWLIKEWKFVILNVDNLKLCVLAAFQNIVNPLCHGRGFPSRSCTTYDDSNVQHVLLSSFLCACSFFRKVNISTST